MTAPAPEVKFPPWIGGAYKEGYRNRKLLILGESAYQVPGSTLVPNYVTLLIKEEKSFYRKVYRSVSDGTKEDFITFWSAVAFYNFVQESVGTGPRQRPSREMWVRSEVPFRLVLGELEPDRVLVLGQMLWCKLWALGLMAPAELGAKDFFLSCDGKKIKTMCIRHPASWGFKPTDWRKVVAKLLE